MTRHAKTGFTIIEVLITIVVIGILAAISLVTYPGVIARANDTKVASAANKFKEAIELWSSNHDGTVPKGGYASTVAASSAGCTDGTSAGFADYNFKTNDPSYQCTVGDAMAATGHLPVSLFEGLPVNKRMGQQNSNFMFYACSASEADLSAQKWILYYSLEAPSSNEINNFNKINSDCGISSATASLRRDTYGMRGAVLVNIK